MDGRVDKYRDTEIKIKSINIAKVLFDMWKKKLLIFKLKKNLSKNSVM